MSEHTKGPWINGYNGGITGPNTPTIGGVTVSESLAWGRWYKRKDNSAPAPERCHQPIVTGSRCLALALSGDGISKDEREANAKLIAAAPELLEACKVVDAEAAQRCPFWEEDYAGNFAVEMSFTVDELRKIRAAIAKAT